MAYKLTVNHPHFPAGHEFDVTGVGLVENGKSVTLDAEAVERFETITGAKITDYFKDNENYKLEASGKKEGGDN